MSMLGKEERPAMKLKAKETEGLLDFVKELLDTWHIVGAMHKWGGRDLGGLLLPGTPTVC